MDYVQADEKLFIKDVWKLIKEIRSKLANKEK